MADSDERSEDNFESSPERSTETPASPLQEESFLERSKQQSPVRPQDSLVSELVFSDPFKAPSATLNTGEGPQLRTVLPGPIPAETPENKGDKKPGDKKDGPRVVTALVLSEPEPPPAVSKAEQDGFKRPEATLLSPNAQRRMDDMKSFTDYLKKNFDSLDADKDGKLTAKEVATAVTDSSKANGDKAPMLSTLYAGFDSIREAVEKSDRTGLTKDGIAKLEKLASDKEFFRQSDRAIAVKNLTKIMSLIDTDADSKGRITPAEVDKALKRDDLSEEQRQALKDLKEYQKHLLTKEYPGATKSEGKEYIQITEGNFLTQKTREEMPELARHQIGLYASDRERLADFVSSHQADAKERLKQAAANSDGISQGTDGSCFFLAPLASMQSHDPKFMDKLIKDNGDGTHTVTFPGNPKEPITVKAPTDAEMSNWAHGKKAAILEKAFADYYVKHIVNQKEEISEELAEQIKSPIPSARIGGGEARHAIKLLTGNDAEVYKIEDEKRSENDVRDFLKKAETAKLALTADTRNPSYAGLVGPHSYVARYDEKTDSVILQNPVKPTGPNSNTSSYPYEPFKIDGSAVDGKNDGYFKMSVADFAKNFVRISHPKK